VNKLFGTSGVRGVVGTEVNDELVERLSHAFAAVVGEGKRVCVARDTRRSGPDLEEKTVDELLEAGLGVTRLGVLSTPGLYFLTRELGFDAGVMITASHNPPEYNGFKYCDALGMATDQEAIEREYAAPSKRAKNAAGKEARADGASEYYARLARLCPKPLKKMRLTVDCACGPDSEHLPALLRSHGHEVLEVNCTPDVTKCDRPLEPKPDTLAKTIAFSRENKADAGLCLDGDNDRIVFLDRNGFLGFQEGNAAVAASVLSDSVKKEVVGSVETGRFVEKAIEQAGGTLYRTVVGDTVIARAVRNRGAALGVEECGHYLVPRFGFFSSTVYPAALLLSKRDVNAVKKEFSGIPRVFFDKTRLACSNQEKAKAMRAVAGGVRALGGKATEIDGVRVDFADGAWLLVRPSGTEPYLKVNCEAYTQKRLEELARAGRALVEAALK